MRSILLTGFLALLIIFSSLSVLLAQGAVQSYTAKIDSVQKRLDAHPDEDTTRVKRLTDLARICFYDLQFTRGLIAAKQARQLAKKLDYQRGEGLYLRTLFVFHKHTDLKIYYDLQTKWFYNDIHQREEIYDPGIAASRTDYKKAVSQLNKAQAFFENEQDKETLATIFYLISIYHFNLKKDNEAFVYAEKAHKLFSEIGLHTPATFVLLLKTMFLEEIGKINEAKDANTIANAAIEKIDNTKEKALLIYFVSSYYTYKNKSNLAIEYALRANNELEKIDEKNLRILVFEDLGLNFAYLSMPTKAVDYYKKAVLLREQVQDYEDAIRIYFNLGFELIALKKYDEANLFFLKAKNLSDKSGNQQTRGGDLFRYTDAMGQLLLGQGNYTDALATFYKAQKISVETLGQKDGNAYVNFYIAQCYQKLGNLQESSRYGEKSYKPALTYGDQGLLKKICLLLSEVYDQLGQPLKAYTYLKKYRTIVKEKEEQDIVNRSANLEVEGIIQKSEQEKAILEKEKLLKETENQNQRWWLFSIAAALFSTVVVTSILYRNNQHKQQANALLLSQKEEIDKQRDKAEKALNELKATQAQLIQSEKMASLGELTAGIAHEIQNPLNFVNNFSEVSAELVTELEEEHQKPHRDTDLEAELLGDLKQNLQKITQHGQRASSIVKGMLEHSRTSTGERQPTDLNALVDEYLRLAYQGLRAKDKSFNAELKTDFDPDLGQLDVVPQEIGRVLLNLFNNAFYAVAERQKQPGDGYQPTVTVSTRFAPQPPEGGVLQIGTAPPSGGWGVEIRVRDNGMGIPESVKAKIFQPFFTTKPTGQGTGLGLSLSYDIITKGHGGTLTVESKPGKFTDFVICLPMNHLPS